MKKQLFILTLVLAALLPVELWAQGSTGSEDGSDPVAAPTFRSCNNGARGRATTTTAADCPYP